MNKRKQWIINKNFQYKFILMCILPGSFMLLFFWLGVEFIFYKMVLMGQEMGVPQEHVFYSLLKTQKNIFNLVVLALSLVTMLVFGVWSLFFSNRIAGPLYRLTFFLKELKRGQQGRYPKVKFRDGDYFIEIADEMNSFLEREEKTPTEDAR